MSRSTDPERLFAARKAATLERLISDHGIPREWAVAWVESWEGGAADLHDFRRDPKFWDNGYAYVMREFNAGNGPPPPPDVTSG